MVNVITDKNNVFSLFSELSINDYTDDNLLDVVNSISNELFKEYESDDYVIDRSLVEFMLLVASSYFCHIRSRHCKKYELSIVDLKKLLEIGLANRMDQLTHDLMTDTFTNSHSTYLTLLLDCSLTSAAKYSDNIYNQRVLTNAHAIVAKFDTINDTREQLLSTIDKISYNDIDGYLTESEIKRFYRQVCQSMLLHIKERYQV